MSWFHASGGELGVVHDIDKARSLVCQGRRLGIGVLEVVEAVHAGNAFVAKGDFLGYDLSSAFNYSVLAAGFESPSCKEGMGAEEKAAATLIGMLRRFFGKSLNKNGLFDGISEARHCLEIVLALQDLRSGFWENDEVMSDLEIVGLQSIGGPNGDGKQFLDFVPPTD